MCSQPRKVIFHIIPTPSDIKENINIFFNEHFLSRDFITSLQGTQVPKCAYVSNLTRMSGLDICVMIYN